MTGFLSLQSVISIVVIQLTDALIWRRERFRWECLAGIVCAIGRASCAAWLHDLRRIVTALPLLLRGGSSGSCATRSILVWRAAERVMNLGGNSSWRRTVAIGVGRWVVRGASVGVFGIMIMIGFIFVARFYISMLAIASARWRTHLGLRVVGPGQRAAEPNLRGILTLGRRCGVHPSGCIIALSRRILYSINRVTGRSGSRSCWYC